jgi:Na+/H+-translocating membrane pyrophosphatase
MYLRTLGIALAGILVSMVAGFCVEYYQEKSRASDYMVNQLKELGALIVVPHLLSYPLVLWVIPNIPTKPVLGVYNDPTGLSGLFFTVVFPLFIGFLITYISYCVYKEKTTAIAKRILKSIN